MAGSNYRPDIDGLRAVAVLAVVAFHYQLGSLFRGGFVGVDVFFVISGFLIGGIIFGGIRDGTYTIAGFYDRRVRRIVPALVAMYAGCIVLSLAFQVPSQASHLGETMLASLAFVSNIAFERSSGYFDHALHDNLLLHTWSLSVEEQFYILFPLLVFLIRGFARRAQAIVIAVILAASFAASAWMVHVDAPQAFFLVQYRAWELLLGTFLAVQPLPAPPRRWMGEVIGAAGLLGILASMVLLSPSSVFPGPAALGACLGTAAIIYAGIHAQTYTARLLGFWPLRFIGLISYSFYLWHWPLFTFASQNIAMTWPVRVALLVLCAGLAALSWRFVERPFRKHSPLSKPVRALGIAAAAFAVTGAAAMFLGAISTRMAVFPVAAGRLIAFDNYDPSSSFRVGTCFLTSKANDFALFQKTECLKPSAAKPNVLIFGDSHAAALWAGLNSTYPGVHFLQATVSGCLPDADAKSGLQRCRDLKAYLFTSYLPGKKLDAIILAARWKADAVGNVAPLAASLKAFARRVVVVGPVVEYDITLPHVLAKALIRGQPLDEAAVQHRVPAREKLSRWFSAQRWPDGVSYLSAYDVLRSGQCPLMDAQGVPVQFDYGHFTSSGSACMAQHIGPLLGLKATSRK